MTKKVLAFITVSFLAAGLAGMALAQTEPGELSGCTLQHDFSGWTKVNCPAPGFCDFSDTTNNCPVCCVMDTVYNVTDWIFLAVVAISGIMVVFGAYKIVTAGGNAENVNVGRSFIMYAMIGLAVALLAKSIPAIVQAVLNIS
jgi:hypothetical protein